MLILTNKNIQKLCTKYAQRNFSLSDGCMFGAYMSSLRHVDNRKKDILILSKGPLQGLDNTKLTAEKEYATNFSEQQKKIYFGLHYNGANSYLFVNGVEIHEFKTKDSEINAALICLGNV